jgi:hypothetical protein
LKRELAPQYFPRKFENLLADDLSVGGVDLSCIIVLFHGDH